MGVPAITGRGLQKEWPFPGIVIPAPMPNPIDWKNFADMIRSASTVLLTAHQRPDGDCLGSEIAMKRILEKLGKTVYVLNPHPVPPTLAFLDPDNELLGLADATPEERDRINQVDMILVLDTSSWAQLADIGPLLQASPAPKMVLDHHFKGDDIGAERFIDDHAEATGTLVVRAAEALGVPLDKRIADAAFIAIASDTGWFRFASVTAETYRTVAELIDAGAVPADLYRQAYEQESLGRIRLIGRTLQQTESHFDGRVMFTSIMRDDLRQAGALPSDTEDIINMTLQVRGSMVAVLLSELKDGTFKISFRSRCDVDCSRLAAQFSGGGHKKAAGASSALPFEETKAALLDAIGKALELKIDG